MLILSEEIELLKKMGKYEKIFPGYITHIRFPRYKNIVDGTRVDFTFPITALVGPNGSGKTSVLNALYGAPARKSTGDYWFSTKVDPIEEGEGSPNRFIYGHHSSDLKSIVETRKARVRKERHGRPDPNYWEPTKETTGDGMKEHDLREGKNYAGRSKDRWNPVSRKVLYINFRKELSAFDKYFYFGKEPIPRRSNTKLSSNSTKRNSRRIINKKHQVQKDAELLARVIDLGDTSYQYHNRKVATENRLLDRNELRIVSFILDKEYDEARWIRHRLFKGADGLSVVFRTRHGKYSEAFAGSGEIAVTSCVVQVIKATKGTLVLLDEPEVSLHPGAQERLLAFLAHRARTHHLQIIFSTHSPHFLVSLPNEAIKSFNQQDDGRFSIIPSTHPYAAFQRLGVVDSNKIRIIVEDRLAEEVVKQALLILPDTAEREIFHIEYFSGGAEAILKYLIPSLLTAPGHTLILLDGDQKRMDKFEDPDTIPVSENSTLSAKIMEATGVAPNLMIDGGSNGGNKAQLIEIERKYLAWIRKNLKFIPTLCPEELVLRAVNMNDQSATKSQHHKDRLRAKAEEHFGTSVTNERTDEYGITLLAGKRSQSKELSLLASILKCYIESVRSGS
ncbi:AAA family ATPase [Carnimonas bestiolae]|uniref:ATP-binding protein n=1 Tax=Carnimonas bestiolae TaxID=3402172 RepID=UPI003EDBB8D1